MFVEITHSITTATPLPGVNKNCILLELGRRIFLGKRHPRDAKWVRGASFCDNQRSFDATRKKLTRTKELSRILWYRYIK